MSYMDVPTYRACSREADNGIWPLGRVVRRSEMPPLVAHLAANRFGLVGGLNSPAKCHKLSEH